MSYRMGEREQATLFPASLEDYVSGEDPVRAYDAFIEALDFGKLGIHLDDNQVGNSSYHPKAMMKLLVYGYSYGWRSSRKLERATHHNVSFMWLIGGMKPDHKTIANFRRGHRGALREVLKQCAKICIELELIEGNSLFLDGSKIRANASINKTKSKGWLEKQDKELEKRIEEILKESEAIDEQEQGTLVSMPKELAEKEKLREKIFGLLKTMEALDQKKINSTDTESVTIHGRQGFHAGYNAQIVVDEKHGLIVNSDVVSANNDMGQFTDQIGQANEILGKPCNTACADAGYSQVSDLKKTVGKEIEVIVPSQKQAAHERKEEKPFGKEKFQYDEGKDQYVCPEGKVLRHSHYSQTKEQHLYRIKNPQDCLSCRHYGICTVNKRGRSIIRLKEEKTKELLEALYKTERGQSIYKKRKEKVELPFGHIKRNLNGWAFLLRGKSGVRAEMAINATCFNIARMITLLGGVRPMIEKLAT